MKSTGLEKKHALALSLVNVGFLTRAIGNCRPAKHTNISIIRCARGDEEYLQKDTARNRINFLCCVTVT
jgi:hypothetical protein